jgi:putative transposase
MRAGEHAPRCQVQRLMRANGIQGAKRRGKPWRTTTPDPDARRRPDLVNRDFTASAPNELWVADFSYLRCWEGVVFFSFVIDVYSRMVVGWQFASHMRTTLVLDALRMALSTRERVEEIRLIHHSDRGSQGGFRWSSQRLARGGCGGREAEKVGSGRSSADAFAGASAGGSSGASAAFLGRDRLWSLERRCRGRGGRVDPGGCPVVS